MKAISFRRSALLLGTALGALSAASAVYAQAAENPQTDNGGAALEQVVVTATRQTDTVNRVPLAVSAQTQRNLDQQGIRTISDLQATVPGLRLTATEGSGVATIAIRGVRQQLGAATTGFYLDETPLQKRNAAGFGSINGTPIPPLFDLDRVEVLRGPQGTLFGGGSEGGTIRYIQPQPSLTRFSEYARVQFNTTENGDPTYEGGVAAGGPIIKDKLGFRASVFARQSGGWIDLTDYRNGRVYDKNSNAGYVKMGRLAIAWAPTEKSKITFSYFASVDESDNNSASFALPLTGTVRVPSLCYDTIALSSQPVGAPTRVVPRAFAAGPSCNGRAGQPGIFVAPGYTIGPLALNPYQSLASGPIPTKNNLWVGSIDAEYQLTPSVTFKSITSYIHDNNKFQNPSPILQNQINYSAAGGAFYTVPGQTPILINTGITLNPNITFSPNGLGLTAYSENQTTNSRYGMSQEFRITSNPTDGWLSYVAGVFFSNIRANVHEIQPWDERALLQQAGMTIQQRWGVVAPFFSNIFELDKDVESAAFGEATVKVGDHWRVTGGIRFTHITTDFLQTNYGPNGFTLNPNVADGTLVVGSITEDPITPKASIQYLITPDDILYANAAKGFRAGGVNQVFSSSGQAQLFAQYGLTKDIFPKTYASDSVWSYEVGGKFRLWQGRAQLNLALYRIDWRNVQTNVTIGGDGIVFNVPTARSQGFEAEGQVRPIRNLTLNGSVAYLDAKYTSSLSYAAPGRPLSLIVSQNGWVLPVPKWSVDLGVRYDAELTPTVRGYARVDYRYANSYLLNPPGHPSYSPDNSLVPASNNVNVRIGFERGDFDLNFFVNNLTNDRNGAFGGGRGGCQSVDCSIYTSYNPIRTVAWPTPRQWGVQLAYRH